VRVDGLYPGDTWSGKTVSWLRNRCAPGRLSVALSSDPSLFLSPQTVVAREGGRVIGRVRLQPNGMAGLSVPVAPMPATDRCRVVFTVTPTAIPSEVTGGSNSDDRVLGAHFNHFAYRARHL
jgi:hypothetical protein